MHLATKRLDVTKDGGWNVLQLSLQAMQSTHNHRKRLIPSVSYVSECDPMWQSHTWMSCVHCRRIQGRGTCTVRSAVATRRIASSSSGKSRKPFPIRMTITYLVGEGDAYHGRNEVPGLLVCAGWRSTVLLVARRQQVLDGQQTIVALGRLAPRLLERALAHCASFSNVSRLLDIVDVVFSDRMWGTSRFSANWRWQQYESSSPSAGFGDSVYSFVSDAKGLPGHPYMYH